jgi:hypothetical protein
VAEWCFECLFLLHGAGRLNRAVEASVSEERDEG